MTRFPLSLIALSLGLAFAAQAQAQAALSGQRDAIDRLAANTGGSPVVSIQKATGAANFVRLAPVAQTSGMKSRARASDASRESAARQFLGAYGSLFGISDAAAELGAGRVEKDQQGRAHVTHKQVYRGVPVFGAELKTHFDGADNLAVVSGT
ncbi:MAG TPA: hypothetical protein VGE47_14655, partial [Burkholderiaceae bacterium]